MLLAQLHIVSAQHQRKLIFPFTNLDFKIPIVSALQLIGLWGTFVGLDSNYGRIQICRRRSDTSGRRS